MRAPALLDANARRNMLNPGLTMIHKSTVHSVYSAPIVPLAWSVTQSWGGARSGAWSPWLILLLLVRPYMYMYMYLRAGQVKLYCSPTSLASACTKISGPYSATVAY